MANPDTHRNASERWRVRVSIRGAVQGVGFRPFIYRLATELQLPGWVSNTAQGVFIEVEGEKPALDRFVLRIQGEKPPRSFIQSLEFSFLDPVGFKVFEIRKSEDEGAKCVVVLPDIATCPECLAEILDPSNRRFQYPFTNCTNCGPRFSIIESLPYDRPNTSMKRFALCPACQKEYDDPADRRFHAQPTACPDCGPRLQFRTASGEVKQSGQDALLAAAQAVRDGLIVAVKGLGGFHLIVDARSDDAVKRLRERKHREEKPLAMMFPEIAMVHEECVVSELEDRLLRSPESPIVLLDRKDNRELYGKLVSTLGIATSVAPGNPCLGVMLPYTPLHHLLMRELGHPVVATSGNLSDEPICIDEREAIRRLNGIADCFLVHNRPIVRHVDDSVVRVLLGRELVLRRARGYAPLPVQVSTNVDHTVLAVGAHLKNAVAISVGTNVFVSQHIGDLETQQSLDAFRAVTRDFQALYEVRPSQVACDMHPDYFSTKEAHSGSVPVLEVQHHHAHVLSCMAENELAGEVLGVSWDGTGYGPDGTVWGGEFLVTRGAGFERFARFKTFRLPGGDKAIKEPRRTAVGLLYELMGDAAFRERAQAPFSALSVAELSILEQMLKRSVNAPETSSVGRLFDAVASLVGFRHYNNFEGQAAMELEFALAGVTSEQTYRCDVLPNDNEGVASVTPYTPPYVVDWSPMIRDILMDVRKCVAIPLISKKFHNALVQAIVDVAQQAGIRKIVLSGGCFQNKFLTERAVTRLRAAGFQPYWHQRIAPNDGGISLGQAYGALLAGNRSGADGTVMTKEAEK
ncbi:MAG: carbamoyltransferase HypF [Ignavibacteria bacterium GWA2_54_16]|nr:MAG: carbamoyltransferase HypF [Ignavibacteria bacterium GWA2_54_16]